MRPLPPMNTVTASDAVRKNQPAAHRHHHVPDQPDHGARDVELPEPLPLGEAVHAGRLVQLGGLGDQGVVEAEGHVPRLRREDHEDGCRLEAEQVVGEQLDEEGQCHGQEDEDGDRLQDVEDRNEHLLGPAQARRRGPVDQREHRREEQRDEHPKERAGRVVRDVRDVRVELDDSPARGEVDRHRLAQLHDDVEERNDGHGQQQVVEVQPPAAQRLAYGKAAACGGGAHARPRGSRPVARQAVVVGALRGSRSCSHRAVRVGPAQRTVPAGPVHPSAQLFGEDRAPRSDEGAQRRATLLSQRRRRARPRVRRCRPRWHGAGHRPTR